MAMIGAPDINSLITEENINDIIQGATRSSLAMQLCRTTRMSKRQQRVPVLDLLPTAFWVAGQATEAANTDGMKDTTKMAWSDKALIAEEMAVIVPIHENDLADADFDIWGQVQPRLVEAMAKKIDEAVFFGTGAPASFDTGLVPAAIATGNTLQTGSVVPAQKFDVDVSDVMALVEDDGYMVNGFASAIRTKSSLRGLRDTTGQPLYVSDIRTDGRTEALYGEPIVFSQNGSWDPAVALMLAGDFSNAIIGIRQDIEMRLFDTGVIQNPADQSILYNLLQQDMVALRATFRMGFQHVNPISAENEGNAARFPFATLTP